MAYIEPDLLTDETSIAAAILASITDRYPEWQAAEGHVETTLAEAIASVIGPALTLVKDEAARAFVGMVESVFGIYRTPAAVASALTTWTLNHANGATIPAGTEAVGNNLNGEPIAFSTAEDVTIDPGDTEATDVLVYAVEPGTEGNGVSGPAIEFTPLTGLSAVAFTTVSSGGADEQSLEDFMDVASRRLRTLRRIAIEERDYADIPLEVPGVARCLAVRLLDPANPPDPGDPPSSGGHVTVYPIDSEGQPVSPAVASQVGDLLSGDDRPVNVTVHVEEPTYTTIDVDITIWLAPDADESATESAVEDAIRQALSPGMWALDPLAPGRWRKPIRAEDATVNDYMIAHIAGSVPGVAGVSAVAVNSGSSATLSGFAPLPEPGTINVTVST